MRKKHVKNPIAVAFGSLAIKGLSRDQVLARVRKATARSKYLRSKYGFGYWNKPELKDVIKNDKGDL